MTDERVREGGYTSLSSKFITYTDFRTKEVKKALKIVFNQKRNGKNFFNIDLRIKSY